MLNPDLVLEPGCIVIENRLCVSGAGIVVPRILGADGAVSFSLRCEPGVIRALGDALLGSRWPSCGEWLSESMSSERAYAVARRSTGRPARPCLSTAPHGIQWQWDERFFLYSEETDFFHRARRESSFRPE